MDNQHYTNVPFEIPSSWEWVKLYDVCIFENGYAFPSKEYKKAGIPLIRISNIQQGSIELSNAVFIQGEYPEHFTVSNGDLLIAMSGATTGKMGIYKGDEKAYLNQRVGNIKVIDEKILLPSFRNLFLNHQSSHILDLAYGGAQPNISSNMILELCFPLPPLTEQKRIVEEIERWFAVIDDLEANKQDLQAAIKQVRAKVLDLAIHGKLVPQDPTDEPASELLKRINPHYTPCDTSHYENALFEIPQSWAWVKIDDVLTLMNGYAFKSSQYISDDGVRIIRITNVQDGYVCDDDPKFYPNSLLDEYTPFLLKEGDLLMSLTGNVGRVGLLPKEMLPAALNQRVACFREKQSLGYLRYIFYLMRSTFFIEACVASGNATAQLNISTNWLKSFRIPLPPLAEQQRIIAKIESIFEILDSIEDSIC